MLIKASHGSAFNIISSILQETIADCEANHSNYIKVMNKFALERESHELFQVLIEWQLD